MLRTYVFGSLLVFSFFAQSAFAVTALTYDCELIIVAEDVPTAAGTFKFTANEKNGSHGGEARTFTEGSHQIDVIADATWLGLIWTRNGERLAQGLFAMSPLDRTFARAAILYAPGESGDQVSISCTESSL